MNLIERIYIQITQRRRKNTTDDICKRYTFPCARIIRMFAHVCCVKNIAFPKKNMEKNRQTGEKSGLKITF